MISVLSRNSVHKTPGLFFKISLIFKGFAVKFRFSLTTKLLEFYRKRKKTERKRIMKMMIQLFSFSGHFFKRS